MTEQYEQYIRNSHGTHEKNASWAQLQLQLSLGLAVLVVVGWIYWMFTYASEYSTNLLWLIGGVIVALCSNLVTHACAAYDRSKLWRRAAQEDQVRLDIYMAVQAFLRDELARFLPGLRRLRTELDLGEALTAEVTLVSERYERLTRALQQQASDQKLADAIHEMVRAALQAENLAATNADTAEFLARHDATISAKVTSLHQVK